MPGYFLSEALRDEAGRAVGVIVIKIELAAIERTWPEDGDLVLEWLSKTKVAAYIKLKPLNCPKDLTANIALDLSTDKTE